MRSPDTADAGVKPMAARVQKPASSKASAAKDAEVCPRAMYTQPHTRAKPPHSSRKGR